MRTTLMRTRPDSAGIRRSVVPRKEEEAVDLALAPPFSMPGRAEEAVQETFASIWRSASSYRPERGPGAPWLYAVARHAIVDRFRARTEPAAEVPEEASSEPGPAERAEASFVSWRVHRALEELPQTERTVIELAYWGGLSQSEVAEYLNVPLGTVKTRTRSGLHRLADLLEGELE